MKKRINVTANDIKRGVRSNCTNCPVAKAIRRHIKPLYCVSVTSMAYIFGKHGSNLTQISLPSKIEKFICDFDRQFSTKPFSFQLEIPQEYLR